MADDSEESEKPSGLRSSQTLSIKELRRDERRAALVPLEPDEAELRDELNRLRPKTRGDCENGIRPCPFVSCRFSLYMDVSRETGSIKLNFPGKDIDEIEHTCALDLADSPPPYRTEDGANMSLEAVGAAINVTRERARQIIERAIPKMKALLEEGQELQTSATEEPWQDL